MVDDDQGSDGDAILESALVANIHRNDLDPLDEARALQRLLALHGSQVKLAKRLRKSQGWVSQRLALLNLSPELQAVVGEEPVELLRTVAKEPQDRQEAALEELKAERARKEAERKAAAVPVAPEPAEPEHPQAPAAPQATASPAAVEPSQAPTAVPPSPVEGRDTLSVPSAVVPEEETEAAEEGQDPADEGIEERADTVPEPRSNGVPVVDPDLSDVGTPTTRRLPYDNGAFLAMHLIRKMSDTEFDRMLDILNKHQSERLGSRTGAS
jgi:ParB family chromosome partitioning protein